MAKDTKKAAKSTKAKKPTLKAKTPETKELKLDKRESSEIEVETKLSTPTTSEEVQTTGWTDDEDMDSIGNKVEGGGSNAGGVEVTPRTPAVTRAGVNPEPGEEYSLMVHFDKANGQYVASVLEFPEISVSGPNKGNVLLELQDKLETQMMEVKRQGQNLPEPIQAKKYPEVLEVPVSQALFRKLDILSRQEKVALEKLVSEIIAGAVEKRFDGRRTGENRPANQNFQNNNQPRHNNHNRDQRHHNNHNRDRHHQNRRPQGGGYSSSQGGQDNFMEYVRNLEKGGGSNWKKR